MLKRVVSALFALTLLFIVVVYLYFYPDLDDKIFANGVLTDAINLLIGIAIFVIVQRSNLSLYAYGFLSFGLSLWCAGLTFDLLDEILLQPLYIGIYVEDVLRTTGMLFTCYGLKLAMGDLRNAQQRLSQELVTDYLTQVANRRFFYQFTRKVDAEPYTIFIIDIDFFKSINDEFGHDVGDKVLIELSGLYTNAICNSCIFARIGGEEFAVYMPGNNRQKTIELAQQLLSLAHTIRLSKTRVVSVSIGISFKSPDESLDEVLKRADQALYQAKNSGRDRYEVL